MNAGPAWRALAGLTVVSGLFMLPEAARGDEPEAAVAGDAGAKPGFLDELIQEAWDGASLKPSPTATDEEFLRRAYLDLLGRIPNVEEASAFLQSKEKGKRAKLVEYLLKHPDYAQSLATQWTVLLVGRKPQGRNVDKDALTSWLRQQFQAERPWNEIAYDLIAARGSNRENGAVNYTLAHLEFGAVPLTAITTRVFLGQQIQCTQCHDHPSNDWKQADFWGINAFFKGIRARVVTSVDAAGKEVPDHVELTDEPTDAFATYDRRNGMVGIAFPKYLDGRTISQGRDVDRRVALARFIADPENKDLARAFVNRMWGHFLGRGFVHPVDDFGPHNPPSHPELLDQLAEEFQQNHYNIKALIRWIMNSRAYNLSSVMTRDNAKDEVLFSHMALKPMTPEQLFDSLLTATAAHKAGGGGDDRRRDQWLRQFIFTFANDEQQEGSSFQGTIPQALMMMNGQLMEQAVGGRAGSFVADLLERALRQRRIAPQLYMANNLYLAALGRYPGTREMAAVRRYLSTYPDQLEVLEDVFWALLNSNEFILNH